MTTVDNGAAAHCPAGHFSPCSDGEKDNFAKDFASLQRCRKRAEVAASPSPRHYMGRRWRQADEGQHKVEAIALR